MNFFPHTLLHLLQGVQQNCLHLVSSIFLKQILSNLNKFGEFWKLEENLYMIGTQIFTIDAVIAEKFEFENDNAICG